MLAVAPGGARALLDGLALALAAALVARSLGRRCPRGTASAWAFGGLFLTPLPLSAWRGDGVTAIAALVALALTLALDPAAGGAASRVGRLLGSVASGAALAAAALQEPVLGVLALPCLASLARPRTLPLAAAWSVAAAAVLLVSSLLSDATVAASATAASFEPVRLLEGIRWLLIGRHGGMLPYLPIATLSFGWFLLRPESSRSRLALLAGVGLALLLLAATPWRGGAGEVGRPALLALAPALLLLAGAIDRSHLVAGGIGSAIALAVAVAAPQSLPLELSLAVPPTHVVVTHSDLDLHGPDLDVRPADDQLVVAAPGAELWLTSELPAASLHLLVAGRDGARRVYLEGGAARTAIELLTVEPAGAAVATEVRLALAGLTRDPAGARRHVYRLRIAIVGAGPVALTILGGDEWLARDRFAAAFDRCRLPARMFAGERRMVAMRLRNLSAEPWPDVGAARVKLAYRWLRSGETMGEGRVELGRRVLGGERVDLALAVDAPTTTGAYDLVVEPVLEHIAWFGERHPASVCAGRVDVTSSLDAIAADEKMTP